MLDQVFDTHLDPTYSSTSSFLNVVSSHDVSSGKLLEESYSHESNDLLSILQMHAFMSEEIASSFHLVNAMIMKGRRDQRSGG